MSPETVREEEAMFRTKLAHSIKLKTSAVAVLALGAISSAGAQQPPAPQPPQSPNMTFFVTSVGPGKGANLAGIETADRYCQQTILIVSLLTR
jgi:hypothetical protein